ncbi:MAG: MATE family efflux transporter [Eubacteriales bacterium]|nr:MATE family efflux transporter [Eubacteriales bacterium]
MEQSRRELIQHTIGIAWPSVVESFFLTLAGIIDTIMVSQLGSYAIAAIGLTNQPKFLGLTLFFALNTTVAAFVARRKGENNRAGANRVLVTASIYALILTVIITFLLMFYAEDLMRLVGSNADTHESASAYFRIIMGGTIFNVISMLINAALRGAGNTSVAMISNVAAAVVNVCLNYLLITGNLGFPALGVVGAAIATVLSTIVSSIICLVYLLKKNSFISIPYIISEKLRPTWEQAKAIIKFQSTMLIEFIGFRVGFMVTAILAARLGTDEFAIHQVGMNLLSLGFAFGDGMRVAAVTLTGQSLGAKEPRKARRYTQICQRMGLVLASLIAITMFFGRQSLFGVFFQGEKPEILTIYSPIITYFIMVIAAFQISQIIYSGSLQAAGDLKYTNTVSIVSVGVIRSVVTYLAVEVFGWGLTGIWLGVLTDQLSRYIALSIRFKHYDFHGAKKL